MYEIHLLIFMMSNLDSLFSGIRQTITYTLIASGRNWTCRDVNVKKRLIDGPRGKVGKRFWYYYLVTSGLILKKMSGRMPEKQKNYSLRRARQEQNGRHPDKEN